MCMSVYMHMHRPAARLLAQIFLSGKCGNLAYDSAVYHLIAQVPPVGTCL